MCFGRKNLVLCLIYSVTITSRLLQLHKGRGKEQRSDQKPKIRSKSLLSLYPNSGTNSEMGLAAPKTPKNKKYKTTGNK